MKKTIFLFVMSLALFMTSCKSNHFSPSGTIYECLLVCDESVKPMVYEVMSAPMPALPQEEGYFKMSFVQPWKFDDQLKGTRNILLVDINAGKYTVAKAVKGRNVWSTPQAYVRVQAPSVEAFQEFWETNGEQIREWFVREELARQIQFYQSDMNDKARGKLNQRGYTMNIPASYMLLKDTVLKANGRQVHVLWTCDNSGSMRRDVLEYDYPYTSQNQFSNDSIIAMRNAVMGQLVSAKAKDNSYMSTECKYEMPESRYVAPLRDTTGGFYAMETRGLWRMENGISMGGPFVCLTRLDQINARVVTAETFIYAPGQKKRNELRKAEAILYTLKMPNERKK